MKDSIQIYEPSSMQGGAGDMVIGGDEFVSPVWQDYNNGSAGSEEGDHVFSFLGNELGK